MKTMKVGIASMEEFKARTMAIARGELHPAPDDPKIWFPSTESFARVLTAKNRDLLMTISKTHPDLVAFVNAVLARERADGTWASIYKHWLGRFNGGEAPAPPAATYTSGP